MARVDVDLMLGRRYRLLRRIATGGMGSVWEAEDSVLHRSVAVKVLLEGLAADHRFLERFRREARAAAGLSHPNVASVFDYGEEAGTPYIVMELIRGETLAARLRRDGRLPPAEAVRITEGVAAALQAAHDAGVIHRDVKPGNIMLTPAGEVKVLDFGIAAASWAAPITGTGATMGTATYISPEQASGLPASPASDVYSLGVVLYEMVSGRPPFVGESPVAMAASHVGEQPPPLAELSLEVPPVIEAVCMQALAKDPAQRPASATLMAAMLRSPGEPPTAPLPVAGSPLGDASTERIPRDEANRATEVIGRRTRPRRRVRPWVLALAVLAALAVAVILIAIAVRGRGGTPPRRGPATSPSAPAAIVVPNLAGNLLADAENQLQRNGLLLQDVKFEPGPPGTVVRTDPPAGASVQPGTPVTLYVGAPHKHKKKDQGMGTGD